MTHNCVLKKEPLSRPHQYSCCIILNELKAFQRGFFFEQPDNNELQYTIHFSSVVFIYCQIITIVASRALQIKALQ